MIEIPITYTQISETNSTTPFIKYSGTIYYLTRIFYSELKVFLDEGTFLIQNLEIDFSTLPQNYSGFVYFTYNGQLKLFIDTTPNDYMLCSFQKNTYLVYFGHSNIVDSLEEVDNNLTEDPIPSHTHLSSEILDLSGLLSSKSNVGHGHNIDDISNLSNILSNKANITHSHNINEITELQNALDNKADFLHSHNITDIANLNDTLNNKSNIGHTHISSDITDLNSILATKANVNHTHNISDINNLSSAFASKADYSNVIRTDISSPLNPGQRIQALNNLNLYTSFTTLNVNQTLGNVIGIAQYIFESPTVYENRKYLILLNLILRTVMYNQAVSLNLSIILNDGISNFYTVTYTPYSNFRGNTPSSSLEKFICVSNIYNKSNTSATSFRVYITINSFSGSQANYIIAGSSITILEV